MKSYVMFVCIEQALRNTDISTNQIVTRLSSLFSRVIVILQTKELCPSDAEHYSKT